MDASHFSNAHAGLEGVLAQVIHGFMSAMQRHGLSTPQVHALMFIYHSGGCPVSELGSLTGATHAAASQLADRLVQQGLVERQEDPSDRRTKILRLSSKGEGLIREGIASNHFLQRIVAALTPQQHNMVQAAFQILAEASRKIIFEKEKE